MSQAILSVTETIIFAMERILSTRERIVFVTEMIFLEGKGLIGGGKRTFLEPDRPFERPKGLFMRKIDRFGCGNDPFCDPMGPPDDKMDPFRDPRDGLNGKMDLFPKQKIIFVNNQSFLKTIDHFSKRKALRM